ncbi:cell number regulator 4-like [Corylus avellana]|uniref:cell number regulator 4-like n=1 Tax=Corylus avellana TaxID=13451 RepID=UPI00286C897F|nr:cell number regulator 4-like [Corylus avellana]
MNSNSDQKSPTPGQWSTGLCGCFEDCGNCCLTAFAPIVTFGRTAELLDEGRTSCFNPASSFYCGGAFFSYKYRTKLRALYSLPEEPCGDFCVHCWCSSCAICQEYRELKNRGFDPSNGWD